MPVGAVRVDGLRELNRAFFKLSAGLKAEMKDALAAAAEPVRADAESLALGHITNIGDRWDRMRVGVTTKLVYVAPKSRRRGGSPRKNLAGLLMSDAMQPALDRNQEKVVGILDGMLDRLSEEQGF